MTGRVSLSGPPGALGIAPDGSKLYVALGDTFDVDVYDLRHRIDQTFLEDLDTFVVARESIAHSHGLQAYAEIMNHFAAGERYLNRVWSASTDGYIDECHTYLDKASEQFEEARDMYRALQD